MIPIEKDKIDKIQVLGVSINRVLIVTLRNSNRPIVIKAEQMQARNDTNQSVKGDIVEFDSRNNVGAMLQFHGTMFSKLRSLPFDTERLTLNEISALRACSPNKVSGMDNGETWPTIFDTQVANENGRRKSVIKISYIEELANLSGMTKDFNQITVMRDCLDHGDTSFVFEMGQILAVDFFIGNHDRFRETGILQGPQNIFFQVKNNVIKATGIDTYDVFSPWSNLNETIEDLELNRSQKWPGRMLAHGAFNKREELANKCVSEIIKMAFEGGITHRELFPTASTIDAKRKKVLVTVFHKGISDGKSILRKKYNLSDNLSGLQKGLASRWKIIRG